MIREDNFRLWLEIGTEHWVSGKWDGGKGGGCGSSPRGLLKVRPAGEAGTC